MYKRYRDRSPIRVPRIKPDADPRLRAVFASIGTPEQTPFQPDPFQLEALEAIAHADCLVTAPTGAGKTWIAEQAIARQRQAGARSWYASPLKALTNAKYDEFGAIFGQDHVGILTGDRKENPDAPIVVGTTEILRNQLYDAMHLAQDVATDLVILDEAHFLGDKDRGVVWEEVIIYLPLRIPILMLSATIGNADQIAGWLESIRGKTCIVVQEHERPVSLHHLFLHPSGRLIPLLSRKRTGLDKKVQDYVKEQNPPLFARPNALPPFGKIIRVLRQYDLLPAIFFLKSRADCDRALDLCELQAGRRSSSLYSRIDELLAGTHLESHQQLAHLTNRAVGAHHAGQLPAWKLLLERMMVEGLLDAIFATSTVAAGVNFPARSVLFLDSDRFNGQQFVTLTPTEFHQMIGRAGRRGKDRIGFAIALPGRYMDLRAIARLARSAPSDVSSQIRIDFSMVLNLLLSHTPAQAETLLEKSFATVVARDGSQRQVQALLDDFARHLDFLALTGYVDGDARLTEAGLWASQLRVDQPLLIAECLRRHVLPDADPALLAALVAVFANDREWDVGPGDLHSPKKLVRSFAQLTQALRVLTRHLERSQFPVRPLVVSPAAAMYAWATGWSWASMIQRSKIAEGDLAMLIFRTADNLRHIRSLSAVFPQVAETAGRALDRILRAPVLAD